MKRRDQERQATRAVLMAEREAVNLAARLQAEARIQAALDANRAILERRRQEFGVKEAENEERRRRAQQNPLHIPSMWLAMQPRFDIMQQLYVGKPRMCHVCAHVRSKLRL